MKIIEIAGGLGNQMCQYAFGKALTLKNNEELKIDTSYFIPIPGSKKVFHSGFELKKLFDIKDREANIFEKLLSQGICTKIILFFNLKYKLPKTYITEDMIFSKIKNNFSLCENNLNFLISSKNQYISGNFFSEIYFKDFENEIRKIYSFKNIKLNKKNQLILKKIKKSNSISIHIRRGDYLTNIDAIKGICDLNYYSKAIKLISKKIKEPTFFVFSDDPIWVKKNLKTNFETVYISGNDNGKNYIDMYLMSQCKHNICANSSFSWWGAYLNNNKNKNIIFPKKFTNMKDFYNKIRIPNSWIRM